MLDPASPKGALSILIDGSVFTIEHRAGEVALALTSHSTAWRPAGAELASLVDTAAVGLDLHSDDRRRLSDTVRRIAASAYLGRYALSAGLSRNAVSGYARAIAEIEKLAAAGSDDAAVSLLTCGEELQRAGICAEVFAAARQIIAEEPR